MRDASRYLRITDWAERRYTRINEKGQRVILMTAAGPKPSRYRRIEDMAANTYLGTKERFPLMSLRDCPAF